MEHKHFVLALMMKPCSPTAYDSYIQILSFSIITTAMKMHFIFLPESHQYTVCTSQSTQLHQHSQH